MHGYMQLHRRDDPCNPRLYTKSTVRNPESNPESKMVTWTFVSATTPTGLCQSPVWEYGNLNVSTLV